MLVSYEFFRKDPPAQFFAQAPVLGAMLPTGAPLAKAQAGRRWTRGEYFRVGCLNVSSYSHLSLWAPLINPRKGEKDTLHGNAHHSLLGNRPSQG